MKQMKQWKVGIMCELDGGKLVDLASFELAPCTEQHAESIATQFKHALAIVVPNAKRIRFGLSEWSGLNRVGVYAYHTAATQQRN